MKALDKILQLVQLKEVNFFFGLLQFHVIEGRLSSSKSSEIFHLESKGLKNDWRIGCSRSDLKLTKVFS